VNFRLEDGREELLLEARLAEHIHLFILPPIFGDNREGIRTPAGDFSPGRVCH
jgi:hypothetical protein